MIATDLTHKISTILFEYDPICLASLGVPKDEYSSEARQIALMIEQGFQNLIQMKLFIYTTFVSSFGKELAGELEDYNAVSDAIYYLTD